MAKFGKPAAAIVIMGAIIAVLMMLCTPRSTSRSSQLETPSSTTPPSAPKP